MKKYQLAITSKHILITSDDDIFENAVVLKPCGEIYQMTSNDMINYLDSNSKATKRIIAGVLSFPGIDMSNLDESFHAMGINVDLLGNSLSYFIKKKHNQDECSGFIDGFITSQLTNPHISIDNMVKLMMSACLEGMKIQRTINDKMEIPNTRMKNYVKHCIENLQKPRIFDIEIDCYCHTGKPKILDNKIKILKIISH